MKKNYKIQLINKQGHTIFLNATGRVPKQGELINFYLDYEGFEESTKENITEDSEENKKDYKMHYGRAYKIIEIKSLPKFNGKSLEIKVDRVIAEEVF